MTPRRWAVVVLAALGLGLLARLTTALLPFGLALAAWVGLGGVWVLLVCVCLGSGEEP